MNMQGPELKGTVPAATPSRGRWFVTNILLPLLIVAAAVALARHYMATKPEAKPAKRPPIATLVEVVPVTRGPAPVVIEAMGEIIAAREVELRPRVGGEIVEISDQLLPGGYFGQGDVLIRLDPVDYTLQLAQAKSEVSKAESDLVLEMGNQRIATREFALLNEQVSPEERALILRQPQLGKARATLESAQAKVEQASLNLDRTLVKAPFNGIVNEKMVDKGARVTESTTLAHLVGTDTFWLRLTLPVEQLQWLELPGFQKAEGAEVRIMSQNGEEQRQYRKGRVIRLMPAIEAQGRMAQLLVQIDDPLALKQENAHLPRLLLGAFIKAELIGKPVADGVTLDRATLHDGSKVWLMDDNDRLEIRDVQVVFRNRYQVIVDSGLEPGDRLVVSRLASPIAGTPLQIAGEPNNGENRDQAQGMGRSTNGQ